MVAPAAVAFLFVCSLIHSLFFALGGGPGEGAVGCGMNTLSGLPGGISSKGFMVRMLAFGLEGNNPQTQRTTEQCWATRLWDLNP